MKKVTGDIMSANDTSDEELDRLLRLRFEQSYGEVRRPFELWGAISPRLDLSDAMPAQEAHDAQFGSTELQHNDGWMPLPGRVEQPAAIAARAARRPLRRMAMVASSLFAVALLLVGAFGMASMLNRQLRTAAAVQTPVAVTLPTPTIESRKALATVEATEPAGRSVFNLEPSDWLLGGNNRSAFKLSADPSVTYKGQPSAHLSPRSPGVIGGATMQRLVVDPAYMGQRVRFSAYIKATNMDMPGGLWIEVPPNMPGLPLYDDVRNRIVVGTTGWERREMVVDVPTNSKSISVGVMMGNQGDIWVAGARLEVVGKDVPAMSWPTGNNFDFEQGMAGWQNGMMRLDYYTGVDATVVRSGRLSGYIRSAAVMVPSSGSGYIRSAAVTGPSSGALLKGLRAGPYAGKRLRLSAYIKARNVEGWAGLSMSVLGPASTTQGNNGPPPVPGFDNMGDRPIRGTSDWTRYSIVLDVPAGSTYIDLGLTLAGKGEVWIDDVQLEEVDTTVATTGIKLLGQPQNTGFEEGLANWLVSGLLRGEYNVGTDAGVAHGGKSSAFIKYAPPTPLPGAVPTPTDAASAKATNYGDPSSYAYGLYGEEASIPRLEQSLDATRYAGKRIRVSAYFKTDAVAQYAGLWVNLVSRTNNMNNLPPPNIRVADAPVRGTQDWRKSEVVLDVPAGIHTVGYGFGLVGSGQVWVDDMQIEVVGSDVPVTQPAPTPTSAP